MHPQEPAPGQPAARPVDEASTPGAGASLSVASGATAETENAIPPRDPSHASGATEAVPRVHLECTPEQAAIICRALDFYDRVAGLGQFGEIAYAWALRTKTDRLAIDRVLTTLHALILPPDIGGHLGASYGIHAPEVPDEHRASFDLKQVIRHALWRARPESERAGYTVDAYPARRTSEKHALAECEVVAHG